jgi:hypothetical protein
MDLHELLGTAVADLPDAPDLVPEAQRIHHRRTAVTRAGVVAAAAALVVGAGTLTIASPWSRQASSAAAETGSPRTEAELASQAAGILQSAWPYRDQTVSWDPRSAPSGTDYFEYKVTTGSTSFQIRILFLIVQPGSSVTLSAGPSVSATPAHTPVQLAQLWHGLVDLQGSGSSLDSTMVLLQAEGPQSSELTRNQLTRLRQSALQEIFTDAVKVGIFDHHPPTSPTPSTDPS